VEEAGWRYVSIGAIADQRVDRDLLRATREHIYHHWYEQFAKQLRVPVNKVADNRQIPFPVPFLVSMKHISHQPL
jgi:hypothetical protein